MYTYPTITMSTSTAPTSTSSHADKECHCNLLTWKDPVKTGKVFGTIMFTLLVLKTVNLFNIFFHIAYIGLLGMYLNLKFSWWKNNHSEISRLMIR